MSTALVFYPLRELDRHVRPDSSSISSDVRRHQIKFRFGESLSFNKQPQQSHAVLSTGDPDQNAISRLDHIVLAYRFIHALAEIKRAALSLCSPFFRHFHIKNIIILQLCHPVSGQCCYNG